MNATVHSSIKYKFSGETCRKLDIDLQFILKFITHQMPNLHYTTVKQKWY